MDNKNSKLSCAIGRNFWHIEIYFPTPIPPLVSDFRVNSLALWHRSLSGTVRLLSALWCWRFARPKMLPQFIPVKHLSKFGAKLTV